MSEMEQPPVLVTEEEAMQPASKRRIFLTLFTVVIVILALIYGVYWWKVARFYEETDNAYVNGNIVPITSQIAGTIIAVKADDTQFVSTGQVLIELDPIDSFVAYEQAKANLAETIRAAQQLFINNHGLKATIVDRKAILEKARHDLQRRKEAISYGAVSEEELTHAQDSLTSARAALIEAQSALLSNQALTANTDLEQHPRVLAAASQLRRAYIDYIRTKIRAPVSGEVSKRSAQIGQRIAAGTQLMAIIPLEQVWVDANFKEKQLRNMRIGQPVILTADIYGSAIEYHGKITGFSAGTGSAFSLLPAQNATGNWIKVVQRLPVRIGLDPKELQEHPLRIGLSMDVTVDIHDTSGQFVSQSAESPVYQTPVYDNISKEADAEVKRVITDNILKTSKLTPTDSKTPTDNGSKP